MKQLKVFLISCFMVMLPVLAFANSNWYDIEVETTPVTTIAGVVLTALAVIWAIRKAIKLTNRS